MLVRDGRTASYKGTHRVPEDIVERNRPLRKSKDPLLEDKLAVAGTHERGCLRAVACTRRVEE